MPKHSLGTEINVFQGRVCPIGPEKHQSETFDTIKVFFSLKKNLHLGPKFHLGWEHPWQSGRLHRTHNAASKEHRWFKPNWMQFFTLVTINFKDNLENQAKIHLTGLENETK